MFSKVKGALRSAAARTTVAITGAIGSALHDVSQQDILGWFQSRAAYACNREAVCQGPVGVPTAFAVVLSERLPWLMAPQAPAIPDGRFSRVRF